MRKTLKCVLAAVALAFVAGAQAAADDFDWSQCWCNYGGGIEDGDWLLTVDGGLYYNDFAYLAGKTIFPLRSIMPLRSYCFTTA